MGIAYAHAGSQRQLGRRLGHCLTEIHTKFVRHALLSRILVRPNGYIGVVSRKECAGALVLRGLRRAVHVHILLTF